MHPGTCCDVFVPGHGLSAEFDPKSQGGGHQPAALCVYDFGADLNFAIKLTEIKEFKRGTGTHYPYALSGAGTKIPEDMFIPELIEELDSLYKEYDSELDNVLLKGKIQILKDQYESK